MKTKEIRASAIQVGDTVVFKKTRNTPPDLVGKWAVQGCSKNKAERKVFIVVREEGSTTRLFTIPWDRRVLLVDTKDEPVPPVADNRSETRRIPAPAPAERTESFAERIHPRLRREEAAPVRPPIVVNGKSYPSPGDLPVGEPRPFKPVVLHEAPKYLDQSDRDALLMEILSLVTEFVGKAQAIVRKAAGL